MTGANCVVFVLVHCSHYFPLYAKTCLQIMSIMKCTIFNFHAKLTIRETLGLQAERKLENGVLLVHMLVLQTSLLLMKSPNKTESPIF